MPRAVVTGGAGFLGSHLCDGLLDRGYEVVAVDISAERVAMVNARTSPIIDAELQDFLTGRTLDLSATTDAAAALAGADAGLASGQLGDANPLLLEVLNQEVDGIAGERDVRQRIAQRFAHGVEGAQQLAGFVGAVVALGIAAEVHVSDLVRDALSGAQWAGDAAREQHAQRNANDQGHGRGADQQGGARAENGGECSHCGFPRKSVAERRDHSSRPLPERTAAPRAPA